MKLVRIEWYDAHTKDEWSTEVPEYEYCPVTSVGWMTEFKDGYVLTPSRYSDQEKFPHFRFGDLHIPKGCVKSIKALR